jgi:hypothetical protein
MIVNTGKETPKEKMSIGIFTKILGLPICVVLDHFFNCSFCLDANFCILMLQCYSTMACIHGSALHGLYIHVNKYWQYIPYVCMYVCMYSW